MVDGPLHMLLQDNSAALTYRYPDERLKKEDAHYPKRNSVFEDLVATLTMLTFFGMFYVLPLGGLAALYCAIVHRSVLASLVLAGLVTDALLPAGKPWPAFARSWVFDTWRRYFRMRVVLPYPPFLKPDNHYVIAQFPHACMPLAALLTQVMAGDPNIGMPPGPVWGVIASVLLQIPFFKHFFAWNACSEATGRNIQELLKSHSVGCIPEGVAGVFQGATIEKEAIFARARTGIIRVAIIAGTDIIPVYHFGNSQLLGYHGSEWISRKVRATVGLFWGWRGLPLPYRHDLVSCMGLPIKVVQNDQPGKEQILETQARLLKALQELYNDNRHLVGWENRDLEIR